MQVMEDMSDAFIAFDPSWRVAYINANGEQLIGRTRQEVIGRNVWETFPETPGTAPYHQLRRAMETREPVSFEEYYPSICRWYEVRAYPSSQGLFCFFLDITERKAAQQERERLIGQLETGLAQMGAVVGSMPEGVAIADAEGRLVMVNARFLSLIGIESGAEAPLSLQECQDRLELRSLEGDLVPPEAWPVWRVLVGESVSEFISRVKRRDTGTSFIGSFTATPVRHPARGLELAVLTLQDVTEKHRREASLAAAYEAERDVSETLQQALLVMPPADAFAGVSIHTQYRAASDKALVGGDFCDAFALDEGRVALVVGDVESKGLVAASRIAEVKYALRAFLQDQTSGAAALTRLNDYLCRQERLSPQTFGLLVSLALAVVTPATGEAAFAVAGSEAPIVMRTTGDAHEARADGLLLGVHPGFDYGEASCRLDHGDLLLMATDGITEARRGRTFLGQAGLIDLARRAMQTGSPEAMSLEIVNQAQAFAGGILRDDVCLLIAQRV